MVGLSDSKNVAKCHRRNLPDRGLLRMQGWVELEVSRGATPKLKDILRLE